MEMALRNLKKCALIHIRQLSGSCILSNQSVFSHNRQHIISKRCLSGSNQPSSHRDWQCNGCGSFNWKKRDVCLKCGLANPSGDDKKTSTLQNQKSFVAKSRPMLNSKSSLKSPSTFTPSEKEVENHTHEAPKGDWNCPSCGVLSFSWRVTCFNCGTLRPGSSPQTALSIYRKNNVDKSRKRSPEKLAKDKTKGAYLKEVLTISEKTRDYSEALQLVQYKLRSKEMIKSSVLTNIIQVFRKSGNIDKAIETFNMIGTKNNMRKRPNQYIYSSIIAACGESGEWEKAMVIFDKMLDSKLRPNAIVYASAMKCLIKARQYHKAMEICTHMQNSGIYMDTGSYNTAIQVMSKGGKYEEAKELFNAMQTKGITRDIITYGVMMSACDSAGDAIMAKDLLRKMKSIKTLIPNVRVYTSAISALVKGGEYASAWTAFEEIRSMPGILLDSPIYGAAIYACTDPNSEDGHVRCKALLDEMKRRSIHMTTFAVINAIECYDIHKQYDDAKKLLNVSIENEIIPHYLPDLKEPRIDLRSMKQSMVRAVINDFIDKLKEQKYPINSYMFIIGKYL
jgi:pentatricopeptide repeat protein